MVKKAMPGRLVTRVTVNLIVAGMIFSVVAGFLAGFEAQGVLISSLVSLGVLLWAVPFVLKQRPGQETFLSLLLAIPVGLVMVNLVEGFFGVTLPILAISDVSLFSVAFVLAFTSYILADLIFIQVSKGFFRRR